MASNDLEGHRGQLFWGSNGTLYFSRTFETFDYKSFYPELVGSPCMPDLYSNFRIFILLEKYSNVAFECLNFVWFLVDLCRTLVQRTDRNEKSQSSLKLVIKTDHDRVSAAFFLWSETYLIASHCYYYSTH